MRRLIIISLFSLSAVQAVNPAAEQRFESGREALSRSEWQLALDLMEQALLADADNLRYGSEYRQAVLRHAQASHPKDGKVEDFDRSLKFFESLTGRYPDAANAYLNFGFAFVDKIPAAGSISQVILANTALTQFSKSLAVRPTWLGLYTRGVSYLFWPKVFGRAKLGVADLEAALKIQSSAPKRPLHVRTWIALGDGYWKTDDVVKARETWSRGLKEFSNDVALKNRLAAQDDALKALVEDALDPTKRVDTDLKELWTNP